MTQTARVVITDFVSEPLGIERNVLGDVATVEALDAVHEEQLIGRVADADALMVYHHVSITEKLLRELNRCRLIVRCGVGYDNVDCTSAARQGIAVANVPDYGTEEVADSAIGMMLSLTRGIHFLNSRLRGDRGPWSYRQVAPLRRLRQAVLGIVGLGRVGTAVAIRAKSLGMDVVFYDPYKPDGYDKALGIRRAAEYGELLSQVFVLSLHCPLTDETENMVDARAIAAMPSGSYLINTARGAVVQTSAVLDALVTGQLAGGAVDVLPEEPPLADDPLIRAWRDPQHPAHYRLLINPHAAFYCVEGFDEIRRKASGACRRALCGQPISNVVNGVELPKKGGAGRFGG